MAMGPRKRVRPRLWGQGLVFDMRELIACALDYLTFYASLWVEVVADSASPKGMCPLVQPRHRRTGQIGSVEEYPRTPTSSSVCVRICMTLLPKLHAAEMHHRAI